jgi:hypothetical protein
LIPAMCKVNSSKGALPAFCIIVTSYDGNLQKNQCDS